MKDGKSTEPRPGWPVMGGGPSDGFICSCDGYEYGVDDDERVYARDCDCDCDCECECECECESRGAGA